MGSYWVTAHPNGQSGHDTEAQAEAMARELVNSRRALEVVVFEIDEGEL